MPPRDCERLVAVRRQAVNELTSATATPETEDVHAARWNPPAHRLARFPECCPLSGPPSPRYGRHDRAAGPTARLAPPKYLSPRSPGRPSSGSLLTFAACGRP